MGFLSNLNFDLEISIRSFFDSRLYSSPQRARRVGATQSHMSAPAAKTDFKSDGRTPTPMA